MGINTAILRTSRAVHEEAEDSLYQLHEFDSLVGIFAVIPFLRSISLNARQNMSCHTMYLQDFFGERIEPPSLLGIHALFNENLTDWALVCSYIAQNVRLCEFAFNMQHEAPEDFQQCSWVRAMAQIKGLQKLTCYECNQEPWRDALARLGPEEQDRITTGISVRNQALLSYLRPQMLAPAATHC